MEYRIFRFAFHSGIHIGAGSLEDHESEIRADTLFSALCIEALKMGGPEALERIAVLCKKGELLFSDAFPYVDDELYIRKPVFSVKSEKSGKDSHAKKAFKKLTHIPAKTADEFLTGDFSTDTARYCPEALSKGLGVSAIAEHAAVRVPGDTLPYQVGVFRFAAGAGLYIFAGGTGEAIALLRELISGLSYAGIGGKRASGLGRFSVAEEKMDSDTAERIQGSYPAYLTLSVSLPRETELEAALDGASYALIRRSGFVFSDTYAEQPLRRNDLYVLDSGSVVRSRYSGDVYDVSNQGAHSVYRYAKPMFFGVNI